MSLLLAILSPIAFAPCILSPEQRDIIENAEFCDELNTAYGSAINGEWGDAYLSASSADRLLQYEYETYEALLPMAESACKAGKIELGKRHLVTFKCMFDAELNRVPTGDRQTTLNNPSDALSAVHNNYGYRLDSPRCASYLVDHWPGPYEYITKTEEDALNQKIENIQSVCTPQDK